MPPLILAALKQELAPIRRIVGDDVARFARTGVGPQKAAEATRRHGPGASLIISTGCCGGLVAGASPGMLVVPREILRVTDLCATAVPEPDVELRRLTCLLAEQLGLHCSARALATVEQALTTPASKQECHRRCGAVAVDMETAAIAEAAAELGIPYVSVRVVLDTFDETLPELPPPLRDGQGKLRPGRLLSAARRPRDLLSFAVLAFRLRAVSSGLGRCIAALVQMVG